MWDATVKELDYLANHPLIRPNVGFAGPITTQITLEKVLIPDIGNVALMSDIGGMLFQKTAVDGDFEGHYFFIPGSGGLAIKRQARAMLHEMFTARGAHVITSYPPRDNRAARMMNVALGSNRIPDGDYVDQGGRDCMTFKLLEADLWAG